MSAEEYRERQAVISRLLGVVRKVAYLGAPPKGYAVARDASILRGWLLMGRTEEEIRDAIEGLRAEVELDKIDWLKPGAKFTLRALRNTRTRTGRFTWDIAQDASLRAPQGPMPEPLKDALRRAIQ